MKWRNRRLGEASEASRVSIFTWPSSWEAAQSTSVEASSSRMGWRGLWSAEDAEVERGEFSCGLQFEGRRGAWKGSG